MSDTEKHTSPRGEVSALRRQLSGTIARLAALDQRFAAILWLCLISLSTVLVLWPIEPSLSDPLPMQSVFALRQLPAFGVVFSAWAGCFAILLFGFRGNAWDRLGLCIIFCIVFVEVWGLANPWGNTPDSTGRTAETMYLLGAGRLPPSGQPNLPYLDFPGLHLLAVTLTETIGTNVFSAISLYLLASGVILTLVMYAVFMRILGAPVKAASGVVLAFLSSVALASVPNQFHPINLSTIYIATFLLLLTRLDARWLLGPRDLILYLILVSAASMEYLFTPAFFAAVLFSYCVLGRVARVQVPVTPIHAMLPLVLLLAWETYATAWNFPSTVRQVSVSLLAILNGTWLIPLLHLLRHNVGSAYPWWGNVTRAFWWALVFGAGTSLMLQRMKTLFQVRQGLDLSAVLFLGMLGAMLAGSLFTGIEGVVHGALTRYLLIAPLFLVPVLVNFFSRQRVKVLAGAIGVFGLALIFPTFLTDGEHVSTYRTYRHEIAAAQFVSMLYGSGIGLTLFCPTGRPDFPLLYAPDARLRWAEGAYGATADAQVWRSIDEVMSTFRVSAHQDNLLIDWPKMRGDYQQLMGIPINSPNWQRLESQLSSSSRIYDNENIQLYVPAEQPPTGVPNE